MLLVAFSFPFFQSFRFEKKRCPTVFLDQKDLFSCGLKDAGRQAFQGEHLQELNAEQLETRTRTASRSKARTHRQQLASAKQEVTTSSTHHGSSAPCTWLWLTFSLQPRQLIAETPITVAVSLPEIGELKHTVKCKRIAKRDADFIETFM